MLFWIYLKNLLRMTNIRTSSSPTWKQQQNAYQLKSQAQISLRDIRSYEKVEQRENTIRR